MNVLKAPGAVLAAAAGLVFAIDQVAKAIVRHELTVCSAPPVSLCDGVSIVGPLGLLRTENGDGAFGFLAGEAIGPMLIALLGVLFWRTARLSWTPLLSLAIGLLLGGLAANLADRALFGVVTDFIDLRVGLADKGLVLNPADVGLAVGGVLFAIVFSRGPQPRPIPPRPRSRSVAYVADGKLPQGRRVVYAPGRRSQAGLTALTPSSVDVMRT